MLLIQTPVSQLMRVSILVEHYFEHHDRDGKIGFIDFLKMHYADGGAEDNHPDRDRQLPFKQSVPTSLIFTFFQAAEVNLPTAVFYPPTMKQKHLFRAPYYSSESLSNIWQPPRA